MTSAAPGTPALRLLAGLLGVYLLAPFAAALTYVGQADWRGADLAGLFAATLTSVATATVATMLVCLGGVPLGFLLARAERTRGRSLPWTLLGVAVQLPLALPPLSSGVLLLFLLGYASPLGHLAGGALTDSFAGIVLAQAFVSAPFLIIAARSAFRELDPDLGDVAATLGHSPGAIFRRVALPICARAILAGAILAWLRGFGEFGATMMVAYHPYSLPVFTSVAFGSEGLPAMLPVIAPTLGAALLAIMVLALLQRHQSAPPSLAADGDRIGIPPAQPRPEPGPAPLLVLSVQRQLEGFSLDVSWSTSARRLAILGASGSGKSMTLRAVAGLGPATLRIGDRDLGALPPQARKIAWVPQSYALLPHLPVAAQLGFATDADPVLVRDWAARLGLDTLLSRRPSELSLGQQQRVALARALSRRSSALLLLDEPFSALDAPLRARLRRDLLTLQGETGLRSILVTHDPAEAMLLADELLLLDVGKVLQSGPVETVFSRPATETAARLLGATGAGRGVATTPDRIAIGNGVSLLVAGIPLVAGPVGWAVRPNQVRVGIDGDHPATITARGETLGGQRRLSVRLGDVTLEALADPGCPPEGVCRVSIDPGAVQVWPLEGKAKGSTLRTRQRLASGLL